MAPPKIGISLGDPGGIGPEVIVKALSTPLPKAEYILFGSRDIIKREQNHLGRDINVSFDEETAVMPAGAPKGSPSSENGKMSFACFKRCVESARKGFIQAVVTAPVSKESWGLAGIPWSGHTDYLHSLFPKAIMAFWSDPLKVVLFSHHVSLKNAVEMVKKEPLIQFLLTLREQILRFEQQPFAFLMAGLNPHAGESGLLGKEEVNVISPAVRAAQKRGMPIQGPFPPDVVFRKALNKKNTIVVSLYHDQGCIPFKLEAFESGVNVTLGLPFFRTSPDHGTAFDIAGQGKAEPESMISALKLAVSLVESSRRNHQPKQLKTS